jgi:protein gp37
MGKTTEIAWTDATFNPFWGCTKVSPGCDHCYADTLATRYGHNVWGPDAPRRFFGDKHWSEPLKWNKEAEAAGVRRRVFCGSMCDWAEGRKDQAEARIRLFDLIEQTPHLDWQLLTKRPGAIPHLVPRHWLETPPANVWYGTSVENQEQADRRIPQLLAVPATIRFLSCEPLLGPVDLTPWLWESAGPEWAGLNPSPDIGWVITGGESGPGARPMHPDWARSLRDQCQAAGVAFFHKQHGEWAWEYPQGMSLSHREQRYEHGQTFYRVGKKAAGRLLDGQVWSQVPESAVEVL